MCGDSFASLAAQIEDPLQGFMTALPSARLGIRWDGSQQTGLNIVCVHLQVTLNRTRSSFESQSFHSCLCESAHVISDLADKLSRADQGINCCWTNHPDESLSLHRMFSSSRKFRLGRHSAYLPVLLRGCGAGQPPSSIPPAGLYVLMTSRR